MEGHKRLSRLFSGNLPAMFPKGFKRAVCYVVYYLAKYNILSVHYKITNYSLSEWIYYLKYKFEWLVKCVLFQDGKGSVLLMHANKFATE